MNKLEILKPFGPSIIKTKVDTDIIKKLNDYTELVAKDKNKLEELNAGKKLAGNVSQEFLIEKDVEVNDLNTLLNGLKLGFRFDLTYSVSWTLIQFPSSLYLNSLKNGEEVENHPAVFVSPFPLRSKVKQSEHF